MGAAFLYGIGAAKAGTTWLAHALRKHPHAAMPPAKEAHYFDSLAFGSSMWAVDQMLVVRAKKRAAVRDAPNEDARARARAWVEELDRWIALIGAQTRDDAGYEALMQRRAGADVRVVADITPAYALLDTQSLSSMAALNGGHTKFLMILRDPVDRLWSNIGMTLARRNLLGRDASLARAELMAEVLSEQDDSPEMARSDYAGTLSRLYAAVPEARRLVLFFEELFVPETLTQLSDFLGISGPLQGPDRKVNATQSTQITPQERAQLAERLRPQYDDIQTRMGRLPARWQETYQTSMVAS
ncbi:sulfotransferase [uncultured Tateyamaria sp.]|uniref:sulfotransferase n=1 Tax=Tateyamaria sp. 1078 TaxID=3417464 RepID=UPI002610B662|nr:sulfotransferase [uncultured Tateyamaria sp.]